ncbi:hypothetical protein BASA82_000302 [Batrachochytrium salamandrivorans]|nr:hypothetical protein BASA82_000302 [Batrachochytrium salamandrivorans]
MPCRAAPSPLPLAAVAGSSESELATYTLHVVSQASGYSLTVPTEVVKPTRDVAFTIAGVSVVDLDQDAYVVSVSLATTIGLLSLGHSTCWFEQQQLYGMRHLQGLLVHGPSPPTPIGAAAAKTITLELTDPIPLTPGSELDSATGAVIGGSVGGVVGLCLLLLLLLLCCRRKKERTVAKKEVDIENGGRQGQGQESGRAQSRVP